jgi:tRNA (guanine-N7-)-methyltransferase
MVRVRQHVNPLASRYMEPRAEPVVRPPHLEPGCLVDVELGCAEGKFAFELAAGEPERMVVGLDIRSKVVEANRTRAAELGLGNLVFGYVNMNVDLDRVFAPASVDRFHLLFPDPWFKERHRKRRVLEPRLLHTLAAQLRPGGELHVASDVYDIALEALAELEAEATLRLGFSNLVGSWSFVRDNPYGAVSRREAMTLRRGRRVWRLRFGCQAPA